MEGFARFHHWLAGKHDVTVHTDHRPLQAIFAKSLAAAPRRLQRMMLRLQAYSFKVEYRRGPSLHLADTLSRAPAAASPLFSPALQQAEVFRLELRATPITGAPLLDRTRTVLLRATQSCPTMRALSATILAR